MSSSALYVLRAVVGVVALSAFTSIWGGWVGLGKLAGFGPVNLFPGGPRPLVIDMAITLPLGIEAYAAISLYVAVSGAVSGGARVFAWVSAVGALALGAVGQASYHLLTAEQHAQDTPTEIVIFVSVLPVAVLGLASVLLHLAEAAHRDAQAPADEDVPEPGGADLHEDDAEPGTDTPADPWLPQEDPGADAFHAAVHPAIGTGGTQPEPVQAAVHDPCTGVHDGPSDPVDGDKERAREVLRAAVRAGDDITVQDLIRTHGMADRWWRYRIREVRDEMGQQPAGL